MQGTKELASTELPKVFRLTTRGTKMSSRMKKKQRAKNLAVLVLGGGRGIGRTIAIALGRQRSSVVINYLRNDTAARRTAMLVNRAGGQAYRIKANVANAKEVEEIFEFVRKKVGVLDVLIYSASLGGFQSLLRTSRLAIDRTIHLNATAFINCVQVAVPIMPRGARIIALSSLGSSRCIEDYGAIGVAKAALEAAVRYLAYDLGRKGITVNAVSGGPVVTNGLSQFPNYEKRKANCIKLTPLGRLGRPADLAEIAVFLATNKSQWMSGQTLIADGGLSLGLL